MCSQSVLMDVDKIDFLTPSDLINFHDKNMEVHGLEKKSKKILVRNRNLEKKREIIDM